VPPTPSDSELRALVDALHDVPEADLGALRWFAELYLVEREGPVPPSALVDVAGELFQDVETLSAYARDCRALTDRVVRLAYAHGR
jgi:hypothetical protein